MVLVHRISSDETFDPASRQVDHEALHEFRTRGRVAYVRRTTWSDISSVRQSRTVSTTRPSAHLSCPMKP
ncbi:hypothetical protein S101446_03387 (plasmid) [Komagataeibacter europaeus]|nr:hypothetical protein S101446_03387 [Komagataeibacter europaeus]